MSEIDMERRAELLRSIDGCDDGCVVASLNHQRMSGRLTAGELRALLARGERRAASEAEIRAACADAGWWNMPDAFEAGVRWAERHAIGTATAGEATRRQIDGKFHVEGGEVVKTSSGEIVPHDEPLWLVRGRDYLAVAAIEHYETLCRLDGCNDFQLGGIHEHVEKFKQWAAEHPERMKQPGITRGKPWTGEQPDPKRERPASDAPREGTSEATKALLSEACDWIRGYAVVLHDRRDRLGEQQAYGVVYRIESLLATQPAPGVEVVEGKFIPIDDDFGSDEP